MTGKKKSGKKAPVKSPNRARKAAGTVKSTEKKNKTEQIKKEAPAKRKPGRSTKYDPNTHPIMAWVLAVLGKTNKQIAEELSISTGTLFAWGKAHPEFLSTVKGGKAIANAKVVEALYGRAVGCKVPEKKIIMNPNGTVRKVVTEKEVLPDVAAIKLWLTNRDPDHWKERISSEITGPGGKPMEVKADLDPETAAILKRLFLAGKI